MIELLANWPFWVIFFAALIGLSIYHFVGWWIDRVDRHNTRDRDDYDLPCIGHKRPGGRPC